MSWDILFLIHLMWNTTKYIRSIWISCYRLYNFLYWVPECILARPVDLFMLKEVHVAFREWTAAPDRTELEFQLPDCFSATTDCLTSPSSVSGHSTSTLQPDGDSADNLWGATALKMVTLFLFITFLTLPILLFLLFLPSPKMNK